MSRALPVAESDFPVDGSIAEQSRFLLHYACLAPSSHNTQPWRFAVSGNHLKLYADMRRALPVNDPDSRVAQLKASPRDYGLLAELGTRPRTTYLAKLLNWNEEVNGE